MMGRDHDHLDNMAHQYARCVIETKNLFYDEAGRCPLAIPTVKDFERLNRRIDIAKAKIASHKLLGQGSEVTAPLALLSVKGAPGHTNTTTATNTQEIVPLADGPLPSYQAYHPKWKIRKVLVGHTGWVRCLDVEPDNEWFVSGGNDRLLKIWDLASGELRLTLTGHIHAIRAVKVSPSRPYIFSGAEDHMVKCWDLEQNQVVRQYRGHMSSIYDIAIHPKLDIIASAGRDSTVRIWDMRSQDEVMCLRGHNGSVLSVIAQDHEPQLISGSSDKIIRCWDLRMGKARTILTHHSKSIRALAAHPRKWEFSSAAADGIKIFASSESIYQRDFFDLPNSIVNSIAIKDDPKSSVAVLGCDNGLLQFYDYESGRKFQTIESTPIKGSIYSEAGINSVVFDKSETRLLTGESDKTIRIWQEQNHEEDEVGAGSAQT